MPKDNNKQIAKNTIYLYIRMLVLMVVSLYTTRVLLNALGINDYGIFNVVGGLIVMITFISQGLTAASRRYIMAEIANGTVQAQRLMYTNVFISHLIVCFVVLIIGETIGLWFFCNYLNLPELRFGAALWVFHLSLLSSVATIMLSPFNAVIVSNERMSAYAYFSIIDAILKLMIVWMLLMVKGDKLIIYALLLVVVGSIDYLMYYCYCRIKFPLCRLVKIQGVEQLKKIFGYIGWTVFGLGANVASTQGVAMLVNIHFSVAVNAAMGISNMIIGTANHFVSNFQTAFAPQLIKNYLAANHSELNSLISRASRYSSFLVLIMLIPIWVVISDLLQIWLGNYPEYTEEFCILAFICIYFNAMSNPLTTVIAADQNIKKYQIVISCVYLLDYLISWGALSLGALPYVVIIVRVVLCIVGMVVRLTFVKHRVYNFSISKWTKSIIGKGLIILICSIPLFFIRSLFVEWHLVGRFVSMTLICLLWVSFLLWRWGLTQNERVFVMSKMTYFRIKNNSRK